MASILETRIRQWVEGFVGELDALVRQAALEAVSDSLLVRMDPHLADHSTRRSGKRRSGEIAALSESVCSYVKQHPGQGVEVMGRALGVPSKSLMLPIKRLLAAQRIAKEGRKRSTRYFPT